MAGRVRLGLEQVDGGFVVVVHAEALHKLLSSARESLGTLRATFEDEGMVVEVEDRMLSTTHPHLVERHNEAHPLPSEPTVE
jgi:hypothetical protein